MKKIVNWIQRQGLEGFITFQGDQIKIEKGQPKEIVKQVTQKKRQRATSLDQEGKKVQKIGKQLKITNIPSNCKQLHQVLRIYSKMVNTPVKTLLQRLDQVSGDLIQLDTYIETKDARLLWTPQEDEILRHGGFQLDILRRYRGSGVQVRKKYLGIS